MNNKFSKLVVTVLSILATTAIFFLCLKGFIATDNLKRKLFFSECVARCLFSLLFLIFYHGTLSVTLGSQSKFLSAYFLLSICSEFRVYSPVMDALNTSWIDPNLSIFVVLFSTFMMVFCLAGYGLSNSNNEKPFITRYFLCTFIISLALTSKTPKITDTLEIWTSLPVRIIAILLFSLTFLVYIILLFSETPGSYRLRHFAGLLLCVGNAMNLFFDTYLMNIIATVFTILGLVIIIIIMKKGDVKL